MPAAFPLLLASDRIPLFYRHIFEIDHDLDVEQIPQFVDQIRQAPGFDAKQQIVNVDIGRGERSRRRR